MDTYHSNQEDPTSPHQHHSLQNQGCTEEHLVSLSESEATRANTAPHTASDLQTLLLNAMANANFPAPSQSTHLEPGADPSSNACFGAPVAAQAAAVRAPCLHLPPSGRSGFPVRGDGAGNADADFPASASTWSSVSASFAPPPLSASGSCGFSTTRTLEFSHHGSQAFSTPASSASAIGLAGMTTMGMTSGLSRRVSSATTDAGWPSSSSSLASLSPLPSSPWLTSNAEMAHHNVPQDYRTATFKPSHHRMGESTSMQRQHQPQQHPPGHMPSHHPPTGLHQPPLASVVAAASSSSPIRGNHHHHHFTPAVAAPPLPMLPPPGPPTATATASMSASEAKALRHRTTLNTLSMVNTRLTEMESQLGLMKQCLLHLFQVPQHQPPPPR